VSSPSVIRDLSRDPEMLRRLQSMKSISWVGGPLEKATGDVLSRHAKLSSAFGSTEIGPLLTRVGADPTDWDYMWFAGSQGIEFDKWSETLFELVIRRDETARFQQIFLLYPDLEEYFTKDLFERHAEKKDLWRYSGRKDDMVLLASGDLIHATEMEQVIMRHPTVQWALIGGDRRNRPCLLLQLNDDVTTSAEERDELISSLWPAVEAANSTCSEFVRLTKELTIFSDPARPFRRSGKDSLLRRETLALYKDDIDALYMRVNPSNVFVLKTE
jgi:acyl-coenzyme A synthetase/AMP-(fatty) acid ligase